jgi:hypothetical protein
MASPVYAQGNEKLFLAGAQREKEFRSETTFLSLKTPKIKQFSHNPPKISQSASCMTTECYCR